MLDLDQLDPELQLPNYVIKVGDSEKSYDPLLLGYQLRTLEGIEDPEVIRNTVQKAFEISGEKKVLTSFEAVVLLDDFRKFAAEKTEIPLKNVFGRSLFSDTTTTSVPEKSEN